MIKKYSLLFAVFALLLVLVSSIGAQEKTKITLWIMPNGAKPAEYIETEIAAFEAANPTIDVEYEIVDWGSAYTRLTNAAISGEGPDVTQLGTTWTAAIDAFDALYHFTDEDLAPLGGRENFTDAAFNTVLRADIESDDVIAMPWFTEVRAILYREDIFAELGLDPATAFADWDSFRATLQTIKDAKLTGTDPVTGETFQIYPIAFPGKNDWNVLHNFAPWVWGAGGDLLSSDLKTATFNSPEAIEGVEFYASLYADGLTPPDALELNSSQIDGLYSTGRVAMVISGSWLVNTSRRDVDNGGWIDPTLETNIWPDALGVSEIPEGPAGRFTFVGGADLAIFKHTNHLPEAIALAQFLASDESQLRYTQSAGFLPSTHTALQDPAYLEDEDYSIFVNAVSNGRSYPAIASWGPLESVFVANLGALWDDVAGVNGPFNPEEQIPARLNALAEEVDNTIEEQS